MKNILLVYGYHKSGHYSAVRSLEEEIASRGYQSQIKNIWVGKSKTIDVLFTIFRTFAAKGVKKIPDFLIAQELLTNLANELPIDFSLKKYNAIVSTHPYSSFVLAEYKRKKETFPILIDVHTDYTPFPVLEHNSIDYYCGAIPKEDLTKSTQVKMVSTGIPVRTAFNYDGTKKENVILITGGAEGFGQIEKILSFAQHFSKDYECLVFCGKNIELCENLKRKYHKYKIFSHVDDMSPYFKLAKFIITKAGGLTTSEAINAECIPIFAPPILSWEDETAKYLSCKGAGMYLPDFEEDSLKTVQLLLKSKEQQEIIRQQLCKIKKPNAAKTIIDLIESRPHIIKIANQQKVLDDMKNYQQLFSTSSEMPRTASFLEKEIQEWILDYETNNSD